MKLRSVKHENHVIKSPSLSWNYFASICVRWPWVTLCACSDGPALLLREQVRLCLESYTDMNLLPCSFREISSLWEKQNKIWICHMATMNRTQSSSFFRAHPTPYDQPCLTPIEISICSISLSSLPWGCLLPSRPVLD